MGLHEMSFSLLTKKNKKRKSVRQVLATFVLVTLLMYFISFLYIFSFKKWTDQWSRGASHISALLTWYFSH